MARPSGRSGTPPDVGGSLSQDHGECYGGCRDRRPQTASGTTERFVPQLKEEGVNVSPHSRASFLASSLDGLSWPSHYPQVPGVRERAENKGRACCARAWFK